MSESRNCPDCGVKPGEPHQTGCDIEQCSACGGQRLLCHCGGHDKGLSRWTGEWPGVAECREKGWYCQDGFGPSHKYGSFCPCPPDAPGARPDLNRLSVFKATGKDTLYQGCTRVHRSLREGSR